MAEAMEQKIQIKSLKIEKVRITRVGDSPSTYLVGLMSIRTNLAILPDGNMGSA
jgi:hypothetical protein